MHRIGMIDTPAATQIPDDLKKSDLIELAESKGIELTPEQKRSKAKIAEAIEAGGASD